MHRQPLKMMLGRYADRFPGERLVVEQIAGLVDAHEDCFDRTCRPGHITGAAWVVSADGQKVVLVHHRKLGRWLQPGGHADGDADVVRVARKEAEEETGLANLELVGPNHEPVPLDIDVHIIPARHDTSGNLLEDAHEHHDIRFLFRASGDESLVVSDESHDVRWFDVDKLPNVTDEESVLRLAKKADAWLG